MSFTDFWHFLEATALTALFPEQPVVQTLVNSSFAVTLYANYTTGEHEHRTLSHGAALYNSSIPEGTVRDYVSRLIGALLRQWRVSGSLCVLPAFVTQYFNECDPEYSSSAEDHNGFGDSGSSNETFIYRFEFNVLYLPYCRYVCFTL